MKAPLGAALAVPLLGAALLVADRVERPRPAQPVRFSHRAHAKKGLACATCHAGVETEARAGLPDARVCGDCHREGAVADAVGRFARDGAGGAIPWARVYDVPAFIHFSHARHVRAGWPCEGCHVDATVTDTVRREFVLDMDWCVSCHEQSGASTDCVDCHK